MQWDPKPNTILEVVAGSHAYGLAGPESDLDIRGIAIPPLEYFTGFAFVFEQYEGDKTKPGEEDLVLYDIRKFFKLAAEGNPNVLELLWVPERCIRGMSSEGKKLMEYREKFLSRKVKHTFSGYAISQLKRIKTHRKWLLDPPDHKPTRKEFGLPEFSSLTAQMQDAIRVVQNAGIPLETVFQADTVSAYATERTYHRALQEWRQYEQWRKTRNPKRAVMERQFGYDTKHAMHLVRLMRMCREILTSGQVIVDRPDAEELKSIRKGAWTYDQLIEWAERQDTELDELYKSCTTLSRTPDINHLNDVCMALVDRFHS